MKSLLASYSVLPGVDAQDFAECLIASAWIAPDTEITDRAEVYKTLTQSDPYAFYNRIYRTTFGSSDSDGLVRRHYEDYKVRGIDFRWYVFRHSRPVDLDARLLRLAPASVMEMQGLFIEPSLASTAVSSAIQVEELSAVNLDDFLDAANDGWERTGVHAQQVREQVGRDVSGGDARCRGFLARYNGEPAGTAMLCMVGSAGYLFGGSCRPRFRGRGVYRSLVAFRLTLLETHRCKIALTVARRQSSAPICERLGFRAVSECRAYDFAA